MVDNSHGMNASSPSSKRIELDSSPPSPSENNKNPTNADDFEQEHCTICLQPFLDRTIIPVCAHEFCFECILLWSEQSRKCPLCSRSFLDSYLIHHFRSQYDYQKHYLPPPRSSSQPPLTRELRATALRNARRERQWGRRQRQQREEADQLERAIARRRWIYQHHLYAKHVASNPYTRYRPFPVPAQFAASPDLVSRMTTFLRRELRIWPNLDVEFLTTYTISLMKSIDIRSESAVKLLSEFLDLDTPYAAGARRVNAEHFAHEIYCYLRSPYRDLNTYDQMAQYDTPVELSPPREIERGSRWSVERSPSRLSRSRSNSRYPSPALRREDSPDAGRDRDSSAEVDCEDRPNYRHDTERSPHGLEHHDSRNHPSGRRHSPPDDAQDILRDGHSSGMSYPAASSSAVRTETKQDSFPVQPHFQGGDAEANGRRTEAMENVVAAIDIPELSMPHGDDSSTTPAAKDPGVTFIDGPFQKATTNYVDKVGSGDSPESPRPSRKRSAGSIRPSVHVRPRNRTLSESVQAYLARPVVPWHPPKKAKVRVSGPARAVCADAYPRDVSIGSATMAELARYRETSDGSCMPGDGTVLERISSDHAEDGNGNGITATDSAVSTSAGERGGWRGRGLMNVDTSSLPSPSSSLMVAIEATSLGGDVRSASLPLFRPRSELVREFGSGSSSGSGSGSPSTWTSTSDSNFKRTPVVGVDPENGVAVDMDMSTLEKKLRARVRVRARLAAIKGAVGGRGGGGGGGGGVGSVSDSGSGLG